LSSSLVTFWSEEAFNAGPYVHSRDNLAPRFVAQNIQNYDQYVTSLCQGTIDQKQLHLGLLPQPYHGDLKNAEIIILLANPGLSALDYYAEETSAGYRDAIMKTIYQDHRHHLFLDPQWAWTGGFKWWEGKLRGVAKVIASEKFNGHYGRALNDLSHRIAAIELVPYHSHAFNLPNRLASTQAAIKFAHAIADDRLVIVARSARLWGISERANVISQSERNASQGPDRAGGRAILKHYKIRS
jgi:hypothetical protein